MSSNKIVHGGDIYQSSRKTGIAPEEIIDFSGNINPFGITQGLKDHICRSLDAIGHYPDMEYRELKKAIAEFTGCSPDQVIVGNGGTELISLIFKALSPKKALIPSPTYSEYERDLYLLGKEANPYRIKEELDFRIDGKGLAEELANGYDTLILCNPNNPTGKLIARDELFQVLDFAREKKITILADETYMEFTDDADASTMINDLSNYKNIIILRGFSKFFAVPGIRLGYCITDTSIVSLMERFKEPWTVNSIADIAGIYLARDAEYIRKSREWVHRERTFLYERLRSFKSLKVYSTDANFFLVKILDPGLSAALLKDRLENMGLLIRDLSGYYYLDKSFFRVAVHTHENNIRLIEALGKILA